MEKNRIAAGRRLRLGPTPGTGRAPMSRSRATLLETLRAQVRPTTVGALARITSRHENTVRDHLESLVEDGFATRHRAVPTGRGRPAWLYEATDADAGSSSEYAGLATALAAAIHRRSPAPVEDATTAGQRWGRDLARERGAEAQPSTVRARRKVVELLDSLGFAPETDARAASVRLTRCPLLQAAHEFPDVVCGVHLGLAQGALEAYGADPDAARLRPFAEPGACRLQLAARRS